MTLSGTKLRTQIREVLSGLVKSTGAVRDLQTQLLKLQQAASADRRKALAVAEAAMRLPTPLAAETKRDNQLIVDCLDGIAKTFGGTGICESIVRAIVKDARESKVTPRMRKATETASRQRLSDAHKLGGINKFRRESGLPLLGSLDEVAAVTELAGAAS